MRIGQTTGAGIAALALLLAACGGDDDGDTTDASGTDGSVYAGELEDGSTLTVTLDVPADHPEVAPFEALRAMTDAPEVTYLLAEVEVPEGVDGTGRFVTFVAEGAEPLDDDPLDPDDGVVASDFACSVLRDWVETLDVLDEATNDAYLELYEGPCGGQTLQVLAPGGATTTYVLVVDGDLPDFERLMAGLVNELEPT